MPGIGPKKSTLINIDKPLNEKTQLSQLHITRISMTVGNQYDIKINQIQRSCEVNFAEVPRYLREHLVQENTTHIFDVDSVGIYTSRKPALTTLRETPSERTLQSKTK